MSTLIQKAQHILDEKNSKIIPTNIKDGVQIFDIEGTYEGIDTSDATATINDIVANTTAYVNGVKLEGTLAERRGKHGSVALDEGYALNKDDTHSQLKFFMDKFDLPGSIPEAMAIDNETAFSGSLKYSDIATAIGLRANILKKDENILGIVGILDAQGIDTSDATATVNDLIQNTTAYVNGAKLSGTIKDERSNRVDVNVGNIDVYGGTVLSVDGGIDSSSTYSAIAINERSHLDTLINLTEPTITNGIGLVPNKIKMGETILGITGTYTGSSSISNNDIMFVEPGNVICLDLHLLNGMLSQALDAETKNLLAAYDTDTLDNYTIKFCDCVDMGNPYNHSGIGLVVRNKSAYIKGYNWDLTTGQNVNAFSKFVDLVSQDWPDDDSFYVYDLISNLDYLENYYDEIEIEYPANLPTMLLLKNYQVQIFINRGNDVVEPISVTVPSSFIRITTGC